MNIRVPDLAVLLMALGVGGLAIHMRNMSVAAVCFSIAAFYAALVLWQWVRRKKKRQTSEDKRPDKHAGGH